MNIDTALCANLMPTILEKNPLFYETIATHGINDIVKEKLNLIIQQNANNFEMNYGKYTPELLNEPKLQEQIKQLMTDSMLSIAETMSTQPLNLIFEAAMCEAAFTHAEDYRPILATNGLGPCIGIAGYDPTNKFGFVVHFSCDGEIDQSGNMLLNRIRAYRTEHSNTPLFIHLRGGVKGMSESTLEKVKNWIAAKDLNSFIASDDTLKKGVNPGSIMLDVRTGSCEKYDFRKNPYPRIKRLDASMENLPPEFFDNLLTNTFLRKKEIDIVYDSKKNTL